MISEAGFKINAENKMHICKKTASNIIDYIIFN